jgi:hypothetical protein
MRLYSGFVSPPASASAQAGLKEVMAPRTRGVSSPQIACAGSGFPLGTLDGPPDYIKVTGASGQVANVRVFGMGMVSRFDREQKVRGSTEERTATVQDWTRGLRDAVDGFLAECKAKGIDPYGPEGFAVPAQPRLAGFPSALEKAAQFAAAKNLAVFVDGYYNIYIGTAKGTGDKSKITVLGQVKYDDGNGRPQAPTLVRKGSEGYKEPMHGLRGGCGIETAKAGRAGDALVAQAKVIKLPRADDWKTTPDSDGRVWESGRSTNGTPGRGLNGKIFRAPDPDQI